MATGLHDLVKGLLLCHAEEHADTTLLGSSTNVAEGAFRAVCELDLDVIEAANQAVIDDVTEYSGMLSDPLRRL